MDGVSGLDFKRIVSIYHLEPVSVIYPQMNPLAGKPSVATSSLKSNPAAG